MEVSVEEFKRIREHCLKEGINIHQYINGLRKVEEVKETPTKRLPETPSKPKKKRNLGKISRAENLVLVELEKLQGKRVSLDDFVRNVKLALDESETKIGLNCSLKGFVSGVIYKEAERKKFQKHSTRHRERKKLENPVIGDDIDFVGVAFRPGDKRHIVGNIDSGYIKHNYPFESEYFGFVNSKGISYNIEGVERTWDGPEKKLVRQTLADFVNENLVQTSPALESLRKSERELRELKNERVRTSSRVNHEIGMAEKRSSIILDASGNTGAMFVLKKRFLIPILNYNDESKSPKGMKFSPVSNQEVTVDFASEKAKK